MQRSLSIRVAPALQLRRPRASSSRRAPRTATSQMATQSQGCLTTRIDKSSTVWCLGHLSVHVDGKVEALLAAGFANTKPLYCQTQNETEIKALLAATPRSLLYVGGAMMKTHPELMANLLAWQPKGAPTLAVEVLGAPHFARWAPGCTMPPSTDDVARVSMLHVASLAEAWAAKA